MKNYKLLIFTALLIVATPVMAYIDPGSGSAIMSAIIGLFVAIGIVIKIYWYKIKSLFTGKKSQKQSDSNSTPEDK